MSAVRFILMGMLALLAACGADEAPTPKAELLISPSEIGGEKIIEAYEGSANVLWVRTSAGRFVKLDTGAVFEAPGAVEAGGLMNGTPVALGGGGLYRLAPTPERILEVPLASALVAGDGPRLYISGTDEGGEALLFVYEFARGHQPLLSLPAAPTALTAAGGRVYFASGAGIHTFKPGGEMRALAALPGIDPITSIAADTRSGIVYLSDGTSTYALVSQSARCILLFRDAGGSLLWRDGALHLSRRQDGCLYRLPDLGNLLTSEAPPLMDLF